MSGVNFTLDAAKRIAAAVRAYEQTPTSLTSPNLSGIQSNTFWAMVTGCDSSGTFWDWVAAMPNVLMIAQPQDVDVFPASSMWTFKSPYIAGFGNAREANNNLGIEPGTVVQMTYIGCAPVAPVNGYQLTGTTTTGSTLNIPSPADNSVPFYVFSYAVQPAPTGIPIHDHRDNSAGGAGFAFGVYAPGTSLPQQPFSL